jgi:peptidyl-prolyl cis-trans isomerase D
MLQGFRKHSYSWGTRILLILLGGVFALFFGTWGAASYFTRARPVAQVGCFTYFRLFTAPGCQTIMPAQIDDETVDLRRQFQNMYGQNSAQLLQTVNLRELAVDQLIEQSLIDREARRLGLHISDADLANAIESQTAFQVDGHFNVERYNEILRDNDLEPAVFESKTRERILTETMRQMITQAVQASPDEVRREFNRFGEKLSLAYIEFPYADFVAKVNPTEPQLLKFYTENRVEFREPDRVQMVFIRYDPAALAASETPSAEDIQSYYERNLNTQFTHPEQVRARHILISVAPEATPQEKSAAKAKAEQLLERVKAGGDFAKLAQQYSDDPGTRDRGGELGFFARGEMVKPFEQAAFKLKPGQVALVESQYGYHVLQVEQVKPVHQDTLEEAKAEIIKALKRKQGNDLARQDVEQDLAAALEGRDLKQLAQKRGLVAVETPFISDKEAIKGAEDDPKFVDEAFKLDKGDIRAITDTSVPFLVKLTDRKPSHIPPFKAISDRVRDAYQRQKAEVMAADAAHSALKQIKDSADFDTVAADDHMQVRMTGEFPRAGRAVPGIGGFPEATEAAAAVPKLPGIIDQVMANGGNSFIFKVINRVPPTDQEWKAEGPAFTEQFLQQRRATVWMNFVNDLKLRTPVMVNSDMIGQSSSSSPM